ncbi:sensor histidine kinase [Nonomuraea lactucae]|uniref:sensor histidine kinase n=1 Tax=Nonomuraea lactucae TaxID=2249762 RepID=UPI000DE4FAB2|nr:ATP-binding protein [Nonomuraea lactucae]
MLPIWAVSLRGRVTLITTIVAAVVLIPVGILGVAMARTWVTAGVVAETRETAERITSELHAGELPLGASIPVPNASVDLIQIVAPGGEVVATSDAARNLPRLADVWPSPDNPVVHTTNCLPTRCVHLTAARVSPRPDARVVYAGMSTPSVLATSLLETVVFTEIAVLIALTGWATWLIMGRALRPVSEMRAELDEINASDLSRRVTQPMGDDELAGLAASVNGTLARLERSADQQRQFASDASHELRTPIAGLRAQLESAQLYPEDTDLGALVESALRDTDRLEAIITDLLLLARIGSRVDAAKERIDLAQLVREELAVRNDKIPVRLSVCENASVDGVRLQLARVLTNLLDNAQRHAEQYVRVSVSIRDDTAVLAVENDGAEIAEDDRERIFERFTRLDAARSRDIGGTGLGLAIARDVAVAHRGTIRAEGCRSGARFVLRLPAVQG